MPKETFYFPHDYSASQNPKISAMLQDFKSEGYGLYWHLIELLHQNDDHKLPLKKYIYSAIAKQMLTSVETVSNFIRDCIQEYELLYEKEGFFYSDRVVKNMDKRLEISQKRSIAGRKSQQARQQMSTLVEQMSTKEKKVKETTYKSSGEQPAFSEVSSYFLENGYTEAAAKTAFDYYAGLNWNNKFGKPINNWKISMQKNWFTPENLIPVKNIPKEEVIKINHATQDLSEWR